MENDPDDLVTLLENETSGKSSLVPSHSFFPHHVKGEGLVSRVVESRAQAARGHATPLGPLQSEMLVVTKFSHRKYTQLRLNCCAIFSISPSVKGLWELQALLEPWPFSVMWLPWTSYLDFCECDRLRSYIGANSEHQTLGEGLMMSYGYSVYILVMFSLDRYGRQY